MFGNRLPGNSQKITTPSMKQNIYGVVQNKPDSYLTDSMAANIQNMHSVQEGVWSADNAGYSVLNSGKTPFESGASIDNVLWYTDNTGADHFYFACNGKLKELNLDTGLASNIDASAGFTVGSQVEMATYQTGGTPWVFSVDGNISTPRKWTGSAASNAGGWPVSDGANSFSRPALVNTYQSRLATANFNGFPSHLILSDFQAPEIYTTSGSQALVGTYGYITQIGNEGGQQIRGMRSVPVPRSNTEILVIAKDRCLYALTGNSSVLTDPSPFTVVKINDEYGAFNDRCLLRYGNDIYAFNEKGIISYTSASMSGDVVPIGINSDLVIDTLASLNLSQKKKCWALHIPYRREMWFALPTGASTQVDTIIVYRYPTPGDTTSVPKFSVRTAAGVFYPSCAMLLQEQMYVGFANGIIGQMFTNCLYDTIGIPWVYEYGQLNYGNEKQFKRIPDAEATFKVRSPQTITVSSQWLGGNNNDSYTQTIMIGSSADEADYGTAIWDSSTYAGQEEIRMQFKCPGNGKFHQMTFSGTTNQTGPEFLGVTPAVEFGGFARTYN